MYEYWEREVLIRRIGELQGHLKLAKDQIEWLETTSDDLAPGTRKLLRAIVDMELPERDMFGRLVSTYPAQSNEANK